MENSQDSDLSAFGSDNYKNQDRLLNITASTLGIYLSLFSAHSRKRSTMLKSLYISSAFNLLLTTVIVTANVLPILGPKHFDVAITTSPLIDYKRTEPFANNSQPREVMISIYNPVSKCYQKSPQLYMPPATAAYEDVKFAAYGLPNGSFPSLELETCTAPASPPRKSSKSPSLPLVIFSGALGTSRLLYTSMLQSIAAAGYLVVSLDHPYDADIVSFPDGHTIQGVDISDAELESALSTRVDDIAFLLHQLRNQSFSRHILPARCTLPSLHQTAVIGHSFGGAAAATALLRYPSLAGGVNLDGSMFDPVITTGLSQPFMLLGHENKTQDTDPSWKAVWPKLKGWKREFEVKKTAHYSFSDLPLVAEVLGLQGRLPDEVKQVLGDIEGSRMMRITVGYIVAFLDQVLKGKAGAVERLAKEFPEVVLWDS